MESLSKQLKIIKQKFPEQEGRIEVLYEKNEDFRSLCSDYLLCIQQLQKFRKEFGDKQFSLREFQDMRTELEGELYNFIFDIR